MFPVLVSVRTPEQLKAVYELLGDGADVKGTDTPAKPAKVKAEKPAAAATAAPATPATQTAPAPTPAAAPAATGLSDAGKDFLQSKLAAPVMELSMKDEPKMKAIVAEYGVERVSLIPEKFFPEVLKKVQEALDPAAAERARLEAIDKSRSLI